MLQYLRLNKNCWITIFCTFTAVSISHWEVVSLSRLTYLMQLPYLGEIFEPWKSWIWPQTTAFPNATNYCARILSAKLTIPVSLPNDNVSMSVGHLDHVLIVYSSMEHTTWKVSHHRPCWGREPCHQLGQGKSGQQRGTATDQMDKRGTLDQEDTNVHESGCKILQPSHTWDQVISGSRSPSSCKQSRRDQDARQTSKHCH